MARESCESYGLDSVRPRTALKHPQTESLPLTNHVELGDGDVTAGDTRQEEPGRGAEA